MTKDSNTWFEQRVMSRQSKMIQQIIEDETWLEGERRGQPVDSYDPAVLANVCRIVLEIGQEMRRKATEQL